jgi:hypothetical protein
MGDQEEQHRAGNRRLAVRDRRGVSADARP